MKLPNSEFEKGVLFIIGMPFSGKSTLAREISAVMNIAFLDTDDEIEKVYKKKISDIFNESGESAFREMEKEVFNKIPVNQKLIVACGGGFPCFNNHIDRMNEMGECLFLDTEMDILISRAMNADNRPLLNKNDELYPKIEKKISILYQNRIAYYTKAKYRIKSASEWRKLILF